MTLKTKILSIAILTLLTALSLNASAATTWKKQATTILRSQILADAEWAMAEQPQTVTDFVAERSAGGIHDFYSEGDYWWPNPAYPNGPYIRRDGETNPENFIDHRLAMIRFSRIVGNLASAYLITGDEKYVRHAFKHINAWFVNTGTMMNPNLLFAQAIKGVTTGRGIGIIDTIQLMEVAQGIIKMEDAKCIDPTELEKAKQWFRDYTTWLTTHKYGIDEMNATNNHGACWVMQVASFAKLTGDTKIEEMCCERFKMILLPSQMAPNGSFPQELARTKPYGYSLFNMDVMTTICQILSTKSDNLWKFTTADGLNIRKAITFMYPYMADKSTWNYGEDVMYWNDWPVAQPALLFGATAYNDKSFFKLWSKLPHDIARGEVERNVPVRNPLLWIN